MTNIDVEKWMEDRIKEWHICKCDVKLSEYLGISDEEYSRWVENPCNIPQDIKKRRKGLENNV